MKFQLENDQVWLASLDLKTLGDISDGELHVNIFNKITIGRLLKAELISLKKHSGGETCKITDRGRQVLKSAMDHYRVRKVNLELSLTDREVEELEKADDGRPDWEFFDILHDRFLVDEEFRLTRFGRKVLSEIK